MIKKVMFLLISLALTIVATFIQQFSSPDSPYKAVFNIDSTVYNLKLPVFHEGPEDCLIELNIPDTTVRGRVYYKSFHLNEEWKSNNLIRMNDNLVNVLPRQKANVKMVYYIELTSNGKSYNIAKLNPIIIRYQGLVPKYLQFPEVIIMFLSLIVACFAGFLTISHVDSYKKYAKVTFYLVAGGTALSLAMQLVAFRTIFVQFMPYNDLSFFKYVLIFLIWWGVYSFNKKHEFQYLTLAASVLTLVLFCVSQNYIFGWAKIFYK
jgi:hypothetical protein